MPELPAYCDNCGAVKLKTGIIVENSTFLGPAIGCGKCDCGGTFVIGDVKVQDGKVYKLRRVYNILTQASVPASDLRVLSNKLVQAKEAQEEPSKLIETIQDETPQFAGLTDVLIPTDPSSFWTMVAAIIALIALIRSWKKPPQNPPVNVFNQIITNVN